MPKQHIYILATVKNMGNLYPALQREIENRVWRARGNKATNSIR